MTPNWTTLIRLEHLWTVDLPHNGDCNLLGVDDNGTSYVEEIYGDGWLAQHALSPDGERLSSIDEDSGAHLITAPLPLPADLTRTQPGWHTAALNFTGPRHRGLREPERIADLVQPLSVQDRMQAVSRFALPVAPPMLIGLAESFVLTEAPLQPPQSYVVCRRVRLAYATTTICTDDANQPYDYDTFVLYLAHVYDRTRDESGLLPAPEALLSDVTLNRPMDCLIHNDHLWIADGGDASQPSRLHRWRLHGSPAQAPNADL